jgi:hypothetical protein
MRRVRFILFFLAADSKSFITANGNHINFHRNAQAFARSRSVLQFSASPAL